MTVTVSVRATVTVFTVTVFSVCVCVCVFDYYCSKKQTKNTHIDIVSLLLSLSRINGKSKISKEFSLAVFFGWRFVGFPLGMGALSFFSLQASPAGNIPDKTSRSRNHRKT